MGYMKHSNSLMSLAVKRLAHHRYNGQCYHWVTHRSIDCNHIVDIPSAGADLVGSEWLIRTSFRLNISLYHGLLYKINSFQ